MLHAFAIGGILKTYIEIVLTKPLKTANKILVCIVFTERLFGD